MDKQKIYSFIEQYDFRLAALLFALAVFFTHAPFFLFAPFPGISMDTFDYFWFAKQIHDGAIPVLRQPVEIPWGYPLFLYINKALNFSIVETVLFQTIIFVLVSSFTIIQFSKHLKYGGLLVSLGLVLFTIQPHTIRHNITLYSESLYTSALILICGGLVSFIYTKSLKSFALLVFSVWCSMLVRPNGILLLSVPLLLIIILLVKRQRVLNYFLIFVTFLIFDLAGNYYFKGKFSLGDSDRVVMVFNNFKNKHFKKSPTPAPYSIQKIEKDRNSNTTTKLFSTYFLNFTNAKPSFYYSLLPTNYKNLITHKMPEDSTLRMFDSKVLVDSFCHDLRHFIFKGYPYLKYNTSKYSSLLDYNLKTSKWMYSIHIFYEIPRKLIIYHVIYLLFWISIALIAYRFLLNFERGDFQLLILFLSLIHLISLFLLPFMHGRFQLRYIHVSEFIVFINAILVLHYFLSSFSLLKIAKSVSNFNVKNAQ